MIRTRSRRRPRSRGVNLVVKPQGTFHLRVQDVGPQHFGIVTVDCAKARSKWMLADFYGNVRVPRRACHTTAPISTPRSRNSVRRWKSTRYGTYSWPSSAPGVTTMWHNAPSPRPDLTRASFIRSQRNSSGGQPVPASKRTTPTWRRFIELR